MAWIRRGTISATQGSQRIIGDGTSWKNHLLQPKPGHMLVLHVSGGSEVVEVLRIVSDTELDIVEPWRLADIAASPYAIDTALIDSPSEYAQRIAAMFAYYQEQLDTLSELMSADGNVTLTKPDGTTITVPSLSSVLDSVAASQEWFDTNLPLVEQAAGFAVEAKAAAVTATEKAAIAVTSADTATAKAAIAVNSAASAEASATTATANAQTATADAATSSTAANTATTQATLATDAATKAEGHETVSSTASQTAVTKAAEATSAATTATENAGIATAAASSAEAHDVSAAASALTATQNAAITTADATSATASAQAATLAATKAEGHEVAAEAAAQRAEELVDQVTGGSLLKDQNLADVPNKPLARTNLQVPSVTELQTAIDAVTVTSIGAAPASVVSPILPATSALYEYTNGDLTSVTEQLPDGLKVTTYTYSLGTLTQVNESFSGTLRITTYQYNLDGSLSGFTTTEEPTP